MELSLPKLSTILLTLLLFIARVPAQITTPSPCTVSMITSFTPCFNFITGSTANANSPTQDCCDSLNSLITTSLDCTCLLISANIPFPLPINRTLAVTLPRVCNSLGLPVQCKASKAVAPTKIQPSPVAAPIYAPMIHGARPMLPLPFPNSTPVFVPSNKPLQILIFTSIVIWVLFI